MSYNILAAYLVQLWSAVALVGGSGWVKSRPYEESLAQACNTQASCLRIEEVSKFNQLRKDWDGASAVLGRYLKVQQQTYGSYHNCISKTYMRLIVCTKRMGKSEEALEWCRKLCDALKLAEASLSHRKPLGNDVRAAEQLHHVAISLMNTGCWSESEWLLRQTLELQKAKFGPDSAQASSTLMTPSCACAGQSVGEKDAEGLLRRVLQIREAALGSEHGEFVCILDVLGRYKQTSRGGGGGVVQASIVDGGGSAAGPTCKCGQYNCVDWFALWWPGERRNKAEAIFKRALEKTETEPGADDEGGSYTRLQLVVCVREAGRKGEGGNFLRQALEGFKSKQGTPRACAS